MAENKHTNDPLEQLFRNKSNEFDVGFHEADWDDMETRLNQMDDLLLLKRQNNLMRKRFAAVATALIFLLGVGYLTYRNYNRINDLEQQLSVQSANAPSDNTNSNSENNSQNSPSSNTITDKNTKALASSSSVNEVLHPTSEQKQQAEAVNENAVEKTVDAELIASFNETNTLTASNVQPAGNLYQPVKQDPEVIQFNYAGSDLNTGGKEAVYLAALDEKRVPVSSLAFKGSSTFSGFAVGITAAPDFSTVGSLANFYTPGFKIGATAEYNWNQNFGVSAGLVYSKVNYTASGSEYHPPYGFWKNGIIPQQTIAECAILSIPVRVKYNFLRFSNSRFYATAGVSSYIMLHEAYDFNYAKTSEAYHFNYPKTNEAYLMQGWSGKTGTSHWLSTATLSIGYEFDISPFVSLRVEPYLNIPIKKVGRGNVKLFSTGSFISLNYHFK